MEQQDSSVGNPLRGVSVHHLKSELRDEIDLAGLPWTAKVYEIEPLVIRPRGEGVLCPHSGKMGASYVDALQGVDHAGLSQYMLSYTWGYSISDIVESLSHHCVQRSHDAARTYIWICCLCINQHRVQEARRLGEVVPFETFRESFSSRVRGIGHVLALMMPWDCPQYVRRVWCVFELFTVLEESGHGCQLTVLMPPLQVELLCNTITSGGMTSHLWASLEQVQVEHAEASVAADRNNIMQLIDEGMGSSVVNKVVRQRLLQWFADAAFTETTALLANELLSGSEAIRSGTAIASLLRRTGDFDKALSLLVEAKIAASHCKDNDPGLECCDGANLLRAIGQTKAEKGDTSGALTAYSEASSLLRRIGSLRSHDGAALLTCTGNLYSSIGDPEKALQAFREAWTMREAIGADRSLDGSDLLGMLGLESCKLGRFQEGLQHAHAGKQLRIELQALETPHGAQIMQQLGTCLRMAGEPAAAVSEFEECHRILLSTGSMQTPQGVTLLKEFARARGLSGEAQEELRLLREGRRVAEQCGCLRSQLGASLLLDLGSALLDARSDADAREVLKLAEDICAELDLLETQVGKVIRQRLKITRRSCMCVVH
eukprot:TRINITY_DN28270_c0_g1_i1.p1 TRINITY_DN28270_c0_g1~~TRINITY_DN28270_c0_g1_i1.p1  ORF type:complete len:640 (+),score=86.71 TRINITY_DN28270_c0_g1_i1:114-1922(+)